MSSRCYKFCAVPTDPIHEQYQAARRTYAAEIKQAKIDHWTEYLEQAEEEQLWTANKYLTEPVGDGGRTRIPTLRIVGDNGQPVELNTNESKAATLAKSFFPPKPDVDTVPPNYNYPMELCTRPEITTDRIFACVANFALGASGRWKFKHCHQKLYPHC
jgi:hypothetical protein